MKSVKVVDVHVIRAADEILFETGNSGASVMSDRVVVVVVVVPDIKKIK